MPKAAVNASIPPAAGANAARYVTIIYTKHALEMLAQRKLKKELADECAKNPDKILPAREDKKIYLKNFGKNYLKLIISEEEKQLVVVTLYWLAEKKAEKEKRLTMQNTYDPVADAMYIYLSDKKKSTRTEEVSADLIVDYAGRELIGIEVLDASKKLSKKNLDSVTFTLPTYRGRISHSV